MDEQGFSEFMRNDKRSAGTIRKDIVFMKLFEDFLSGRNKTLDEAVPKDLQEFLEVVDAKYRYGAYLSATWHYYAYTGNDRMRYALDELDYQRPQPYRLTKHIGVNPAHVNSLAAAGIKVIGDLIQAGKTEADRKNLSEPMGIPYDDLLELVKLSDLSRKFGPKRARLYYDAGYDTFDKIAGMDPEVLKDKLIEHINKMGITTALPTLGEVDFSVEGAKRRPRLVKY
jgi:hypothetical protein